jgi:hypothetical protein
MSNNKIDFSNVRVGDEVTVRMVVVETDSGDSLPVRVRCTDDHPGVKGLWPPAADILSHTSKGFEIGDKVRVKGSAGVYTVAGVCHPYVWISQEGLKQYGPVTFNVSELERIS